MYVNEKKIIQEIKDLLIQSKVWENIKLFCFFLTEEPALFSVEVTCDAQDYPEDFNISWAVSMLKSLPWPPSFSVIRSQPPRYQP